MKIEKQFYCASEFASLLGVSRQAIYQRMSNGKLPTVRFGGVRLIPAEIVTREVAKAVAKWDKDNERETRQDEPKIESC